VAFKSNRQETKETQNGTCERFTAGDEKRRQFVRGAGEGGIHGEQKLYPGETTTPMGETKKRGEKL